MTSKTLTGTYSGGYTINDAVTYLTVASTGVISGTLFGPSSRTSALSVANYGRIAGGNSGAADGVYIHDSAAAVSFTNGSTAYESASISGYNEGVGISAAQATVTNYGHIAAAAALAPSYNDTAVFIFGQGTVVNGSAADTSALISGSDGVLILQGAGSLTNYGSIQVSPRSKGAASYDGLGVLMNEGGTVTNGSNTDRTAFIENTTGVFINRGMVNNYGTIVGQSDYGSSGHSGVGCGIYLGGDGEGAVTNGSSADTAAVIRGATDGVYAASQYEYAPGVVLNLGSIVGGFTPGNPTTKVKYNAGVVSHYDVVVNGGASDTKALIEGYDGVVIEFLGYSHPALNYGTIKAIGGDGVLVTVAATIENKGTSSLIEGFNGLVGSGTGYGHEVVAYNYGTISGYGGAAVSLQSAGFIFNESSGVLTGYRGVVGASANHLYNYGLILASGGPGVAGGGNVLNDGTIDSSAGVGVSLSGQMTNNGEVVGVTGAELSGGAHLQNAGTIDGVGGTAVNVGVGNSLTIEPGCVFIGTVQGAGGGLTLDGGAGTISLTAGANVVVSGSMARTTFYNFGTVDLDGAASETLHGGGTVAGGEYLFVDGVLIAADTLNLAANSATPSAGGMLVLNGTLSGAGTLLVSSGALADFAGGADLAIDHVTLNAQTSRAEFTGGNLVYAGDWRQASGTLSMAGGASVDFTGAGDLFQGTVSGVGAMSLTAGTDTLTNLRVETQLTISGTAAVSMAGTTTLIGPYELDIAGGSVTVGRGTGNATLAGGGTLVLGFAALVSGLSATTALLNRTTIEGAGQLGDGHMRLVNYTGAVINANASAALTIDTGAETVSNQALIESTGSGGLTIASAVVNNGTLACAGGDMTLDLAVDGSGSASINGGTLDFKSTFNENVSFGSTGVLELADSTGYHGEISGFSTSGTTSLVLDDITFGVDTTATYSGTASGGVLTVTDGTTTAHINFLGDYTSSTWTVTADGSGVMITDPTKAKGPTAAPLLVQAAAGLGGAEGSAPTSSWLTAHASRPLALLAAHAA